nr:hypothetical protein [Tanacetum cinerariifolium]
MGDENPIRTLGDYSKPSHEGYMNTKELLVGNNMVPFRSDTIQLVQNGCSFHGLQSEDPNQHLKDFLKLVDSLDLDGSIITYEDLTTYFLAQLFPPERTTKLHNDILMFQQHHGESLSEAWTRFKDLLKKVHHHGIECVVSGKLHDKNADKSSEIIENLALYDHEGWKDTEEFIKLVKAISTPQSTSKTPDRRLLELEDQVNFLLKGSRLTPRPSSTHIPQAYAEAIYSNPRPQNKNKPPKQNPFTFHEPTVRDYMAAHTKRIKSFKNTIFKQREEINERMTEMFGLLKELMTSRAPEKVLIREEAKFPITKNVNSISLTRGEEKRSEKTDITTDDEFEKPTKTKIEMPIKEAEKDDEAENEPNRKSRNEETTEPPSSQPIEYYLKHRINKKLIEGLVGTHRFNDSLSGARVRKIKGKTYNLSPRWHIYEAVLRKKITRSDVNVMPLSTYMKLTDKRPAEMDIRLSLASHSYIYPLGIAEDILVEVTEHVYPVDFVILDIKEDEKRPFILGTPFLTMAMAVIKFDKCTITLRSRKKCAVGGKLRDKNADKSSEIIENLALYDHEGWKDIEEFIKLVKAISTPQSTSKTPDRRLLELEDQVNFLLKGSRPTPRPRSTHIPQAYAEAIYSNPRTPFEAQVRDYMATHTKRIKRFENAIFKQCEEINDRMTEMFGLLKELTTSRAPEKVLIREEAKFPITKNVNSISLTRGEEERSEKTNITTDDDFKKPTKTKTEMPIKEAEKDDEAENEPNRKARKKETTEPPSSQPVEYYLKHRINKKLIEGLMGNHRFNDSLSGARVRKIKGKTYNLSPRWPIYEAVLRKKITRSDVNVMPLSTYMKLTDKRPVETDIRLSLASHSYIYPLGIAEDILVEVAEHVYPMDFVILDIKEDEKRPFILGTPFLTTAVTPGKFWIFNYYFTFLTFRVGLDFW